MATVVVVAGALPTRLTADTGRSQPPQQLSQCLPLPLAVAARGADTASIEPGGDSPQAARAAPRSSLTSLARALYGRYAGLMSLRRKPGAVDTMQRLFAVF